MTNFQSQPPKSYVLFLHGLGACSYSFAPLIAELSKTHGTYEWIAIDFYGFGNRKFDDSFHQSVMVTFAKQVADEIYRHDVSLTKSWHIVGHSMGGAVATLMHHLFPQIRIASFINLEGNLTLNDCTTSLSVSQQSKEEFCRFGFSQLKAACEKIAQNNDISAQDWLYGLERTSAEVFYEASTHLVKLSHDLYQYYHNWKTKSLYVFGEKTLNTPQLTYDKLMADRQNIAIIPNAGHVMMIEQPTLVAHLCLNHWNTDHKSINK